jgi:uncharacterized protein (TIGR02246 family)
MLPGGGLSPYNKGITMSNAPIPLAIAVALLICPALQANKSESQSKNPNQKPKLSSETVCEVKKEINAFYDEYLKRWKTHDIAGAISYVAWNSPDYTDVLNGITYHGFNEILNSYKHTYDGPEKMGQLSYVTRDIEVYSPESARAHSISKLTAPDGKTTVSEGYDILKKFGENWKVVESYDANEAVKKEIRTYFAELEKLWNAHDLDGFAKRSMWYSPNYIEVTDGVTYHGSEEPLSLYKKIFDQPEKMGHLNYTTIDIDVVNANEAKVYVIASARRPSGKIASTDGFDTLRKFGNGWTIVASYDTSNEKQKIKDVYTAMMQQWNKHNLEGFFRYYWQSPNFINVEDGVISKGWEAAFNRFKTAFPDSPKMGSIFIQVMDVELASPDTALAVARTTIYLDNGDVIPSDTFSTFKKFSEGWKIIANQDVSVAP